MREAPNFTARALVFASKAGIFAGVAEGPTGKTRDMSLIELQLGKPQRMSRFFPLARSPLIHPAHADFTQA